MLDRHYVSDSDPTADSDNILVDNIIGVTLELGEINDNGHNFTASDNHVINGPANDDDAQPALTGDMISLSNATGAVIAKMITDSTGLYQFTDLLESGEYTATDTNSPGYKTDVGDGATSTGDASADNLIHDAHNTNIPVTLLPSATDSGNHDFVDSNKGTRSGSAIDDVAYSVIATKNPDGHLSNVCYDDIIPYDIPDERDADKTLDNSILVTVQPSNQGNDFVNSNNGSISGTAVKDDNGKVRIPTCNTCRDAVLVHSPYM